MTDVLTRLTAALADRYRIERELGAGGMATVYLAHDLKHARFVAIKVLKPELGAVLGGDRFLTEITVTANLQHPHLLPLFDSGVADGFLYYVMPFIEGETLRAWLQRDAQLPVDETLRLITIMSGALDFAHARGVVHRDLKPENILLQAGEPVIADFGIALAVSNAGGARVTQTGLSLGTPHYMSPEQATGDRAVDARSDQYALAAVAYEMLTGEPPHSGATAQVIIARVITETPRSIRSSRPAVPAAVDSAILRALSKVPADRFSSCGALARALTDGAAATTARPPRRWLPVALGAALLTVAAIGSWLWSREETPTLVVGKSAQLTSDEGLKLFPALSPDGKLVAFSAGTSMRMRVYIRPVNGGRTIPLSDDSTNIEFNPRWSPDGTTLLYLNGGVSIAPALGGSSRAVIAPGVKGVISAAWSPDGKAIAYVTSDSLMVQALAGGAPRFIAAGNQLHSCAWSPSGTWIACTSGNPAGSLIGPNFGNSAPSAIVVVPASGGAFKTVTASASASANLGAVWSADGEYLYFLSNRDGPRDIYGVRLTASGMPRTEPTRLTTGLGALSFSLSADGTRLTYMRYAVRANIWSLPLADTGTMNVSAATALTNGAQVIEAISVSADGRWILYDSDLSGNSDIYRIRVEGGDAEQLTSEPFDEFAPDLSPDGRLLAYHSFRTGSRDVEVKPLDGGPVVPVTNTPGDESYPRWFPDGNRLSYFDQADFQLRVASRDGSGRWPTPHRAVASNASPGDWSPDRASIAYLGGNGRPDIQVAPSSGGPSRTAFAPTARAMAPDNVLWSGDGRMLYFKSHDARGLTSFFALPSEGGSPRLLTHFPDPNRQSSRPDFAVSNTHLFFTIEDRQSDVFVADVKRK